MTSQVTEFRSKVDFGLFQTLSKENVGRGDGKLSGTDTGTTHLLCTYYCPSL